MTRLFTILLTIFGLTACSSGVSNSGAGAVGTNCQSGGLNLVCTATIAMSSTTVDACPSDTDGDGVVDEVLGTDTGTLTITVTDPLGQFSQVFQGMTFDSYDVSYASGDGRAPGLGPRQFANTLAITLSDSTGSGSVTIPIVDVASKNEFEAGASCSTFFPYQVTVRANGRDFATNTPVVVVARISIQIGDTSI